MNRRDILSLIGLSAIFNPYAMTTASIDPEKHYFDDDGKIPNSKLPLLIYRNALPDTGSTQVKKHFEANNWTNSWDNGIYPYHHYHSTTHEVLGVYSGSALLHLGGESGGRLRVMAGDILVIPAGVGHKRLESSNDFAVVGAYPEGRDWDLLKGEPGERPKADKNIASLPLPKSDPLLGRDSGLAKIWK